MYSILSIEFYLRIQCRNDFSILLDFYDIILGMNLQIQLLGEHVQLILLFGYLHPFFQVLCGNIDVLHQNLKFVYDQLIQQKVHLINALLIDAIFDSKLFDVFQQIARISFDRKLVVVSVFVVVKHLEDDLIFQMS